MDRYLVAVKVQGNIKIAQFGQNNGNPAFAGVDIYNFIKGNSMTRFKRLVSQLGEVSEKEMNEARERNLPLWNMGSLILEEVMEQRIEKVILRPSYMNDVFCDWLYILDLDADMFRVRNSAEGNYNIKNLPHVLKFLDELGDGYPN